jgi:hypothetical protein
LLTCWCCLAPKRCIFSVKHYYSESVGSFLITALKIPLLNFNSNSTNFFLGNCQLSPDKTIDIWGERFDLEVQILLGNTEKGKLALSCGLGIHQLPDRCLLEGQIKWKMFSRFWNVSYWAFCSVLERLQFKCIEIIAWKFLRLWTWILFVAVKSLVFSFQSAAKVSLQIISCKTYFSLGLNL